ncbi:MAG: transglutaminase-like domain-containing protein [Deltaproteobacteria bacterium]|nr:transglutaminase-like domain-containing protein [Deltaproteobacteria bacterium]
MPPSSDATDADTEETEEIIISEEIIEKAAELNNDWLEIFEWVRNNINCEWYYGSEKGSQKTLEDMAGNNYDTSSLLIALLRASGIHSRYVQGEIEIDIGELMNWTGALTEMAAVNIVHQNRIPITAVGYYDEEGEVVITSARIDHIWVEARYKNNWILMEPFYKTYTYSEGTESSSDEGVETLISAITTSENTVLFDMEKLNTGLQEQTDSFLNVAGDLTMDELLGKKEIKQTTALDAAAILSMAARGWYSTVADLDDNGKVNSLDALMFLNSTTLPGLAMNSWEPEEELVDRIPEEMRVKMKIALPGSNEYSYFLSEVAGKRLSLVYIPATDEDQSLLDEYGSIYDIPNPSTMQMKPVLQIDGEIVAESSKTTLGKSNQEVSIEFQRPGTDGEWEVSAKNLTAGTRYNIVMAIQKVSLEKVKELTESFEAQMEALPPDEPMSDEMIDESLYLAGLLYFGMIDGFSDFASRSLSVECTRQISMGFTFNEIKSFVDETGKVAKIEKGGNGVDIVRNVVTPVSLEENEENENSWFIAYGSIGSNAEHLVFEILYNIESVSTGKIFQTALDQGMSIHIIDDAETLETNLSAITAEDAVKDHIRSYVHAGYIAMIPQNGITIGEWSGQGWIVLDKDMDSAAYMIQGNLGEITNGGGNLNISR